MIGLTSDDTTEGTVLPGSLTFTSINWDTLQEVTVTGVDAPAPSAWSPRVIIQPDSINFGHLTYRDQFANMVQHESLNCLTGQLIPIG